METMMINIISVACVGCCRCFFSCCRIPVCVCLCVSVVWFPFRGSRVFRQPLDFVGQTVACPLPPLSPSAAPIKPLQQSLRTVLACFSLLSVSLWSKAGCAAGVV